MMRPSAAASSVVICSSCRFSKTAVEDPLGHRGGALFINAVRACLASHACRDDIVLQPIECLFGCSHHCTAYVRSHGRFGYVLGHFTPSRSHAQALLDYIAQYLKTGDGVVPYSQWPTDIKGHFLVRVPPDGFVFESSKE